MDAVVTGVKSSGLGSSVALPLRHHLPSLFLLACPVQFLTDNVEYT